MACRGLSPIMTLFVTQCRSPQCATPDCALVAVRLLQRSAKIPPATQLNRAAKTGPHRHAIFLICSRSCVRDHSLRHRHSCGPVRRFRSGHLVAIKLDSHSQVSARRRNRFHSHHVPRAAPFACWLSQHYFRHIEKNFHGFALVQHPVRRKIDSLPRNVYRLRGLLWIR